MERDVHRDEHHQPGPRERDERGVVRTRDGHVQLVGAAPEEVSTLAAELARHLEGEVRFDAGARALYATDASNYRQLPLGVVIPKNTDDVVRAVAIARERGAPILSRGGGTSLAGQCCNVAVVLDFSKYLHGVLAIDAGARRARVLPGTILDTLRDAAVAHDLTFGPDPATHDHCTIGGMLGNDSCGAHSVMAGRTADNVEELEILTYDGLRMRVGRTSPEELDAIVRAGGRRGEIYGRLRDLRCRYSDLVRARYPKIPRRVSGYNLDELLPENGFDVARALVGTEGTCVTILEATVRLVPWPRHRVLVVASYPDVYAAADHVTEIMGFRPLALEGFDSRLIEDVRKKHQHDEDLDGLPGGDDDAYLLVELGGDSPEVAAREAHRLMDALGRFGAKTSKLYRDPSAQEAIWKVRESGLGATARVPGEPDTWPGWEDSAVPPERLGDYLRELRKLYDRHGYHPALYGHFGQGCVHCRIDFDLTSAPGIAHYRAFMDEATSLVVAYGGSLSGEHGDGQSRAEFLPKMFGPELVQAFREFKAIWDPDGKMNPGKVVDPHRIDEDLRLGASFRDPHVETHFKFPEDDGSFLRATLRCVGVGKCRRTDGGTMCPSFMVTREEEHTTRGRAHMLFEMMQGEELGGFRDDQVRESLDLCLACKGCKGDCPVDVDMATYKAEFLSHHYEHRIRPMPAYTMGLIHVWSRLASHAPGVANLLTRSPVLSGLVKRLGGIAPERKIPAFARQTFKEWFFARTPRNEGGPEILLWPDTFNNHFHPETAIAATSVLEAAGYHVLVPKAALCCGRPLYDFGMLTTAERLLRRVLRELEEPIRRGVRLVGLEPSCVAVFKDELHGLMPDDPLAEKLRAQSLSFAELLRDERDLELPRLDRRAIVQGHCHHKAIWKMDDEEDVLRRLGVDYEIPDSGCCGMAGSFGFEAGEKYEVSVKAGERVLLPKVRAAAPDTLVIADGFSCREQIAQGSARRGLHLAEVVHMAMLHGASGPRIEPPEDAYLPPRDEVYVVSAAKAFAVTGGAAIGAAALSYYGGTRRIARTTRGQRRRIVRLGSALAAAGLIGVVAAIARRQPGRDRARRAR